MSIHRFFILFLFLSFLSCNQPVPNTTKQEQTRTSESKLTTRISKINDISDEPELLIVEKEVGKDLLFTATKGALLMTKFKSLDELKAIIQIEYFNTASSSGSILGRKPHVRLIHSGNGQEVTSILKLGISEADFRKAGVGSFWDKVKLAIDSPYFVVYRMDMLRIYNLARRRGTKFGEGDMAFYDLAESMFYHINDHELVLIPTEDLSEKGYLNTFNHVTSQAFMTSIFSRKLADFVADTHERRYMPELITGKFTEDQLTDLANGPVDNYVDMINNEYGQELGKILQKKYNIHRKTYWTPELLASYLNDIQRYYSWTFQIGFKPFRATDKVVIRFSKKINSVMKDVPGFR